ncbi:MAG: M48 family metallopeptidase [Gemmatimonadales bacterium]
MTKVLTQIAPEAWEHAADRAALNALRNVPGFDEAVKKIFGFFGERGIRLLFQANSVKVGPRQFPKLDGLLDEVCATMDWPTKPELYVTQTPLVNAGAVGFREPFIVLNSAALELLNEDETRVLIGHELGHIMSGHAVYRTIAALVLTLGFNNLPFLAGIALMPIRFALLEWYRKSELSADRVGLLSTQDVNASTRLFFKMAGGVKPLGGAVDLGEGNMEVWREQARAYDESGGPLDSIYKILNTLALTHPFSLLRTAELDRWIATGTYERILAGEYPHRGPEQRDRRYLDDLAEAATHYGNEARDVAGEMADAARRAASAFAKAFRGGNPQG